MLDHDELLPEERTYPDLTQQLRTTYELKPDEKQVLARVHARLARSSQPLPAPEPVPAENYARSPEPALPISIASRTGFRQRWLRPLNVLVAVLFLGLLVGSLALTFHSRTGDLPTAVGGASAIHLLLVPAQKGSLLSQAEMEATGNILSLRFSGFGLAGVSVRVLTNNGRPAIQVNLPHFGGNEQQTIGALVETGVVDFWSTGSEPLPLGAHFDPAQFSKYNPGGHARFTNHDLDPATIVTSQDVVTGQPQVNFAMKGAAAGRFLSYTTDNIGNYLTITLDDRVVESAVLQAPISGTALISSNFTQQQARALVSVLKYGSLPVSLTIQT